MGQQDTLAERLAALAASYAAQLPATIKTMEKLAGTAPTDAIALRDLGASAHKLAGSAGTFGLQDVSDCARRLEAACLAMGEAASREAADEVQRIFAELKAIAADQAGKAGSTGHTQSAETGTILGDADTAVQHRVRLALSNGEETHRLREALHRHGFETVALPAPGIAPQPVLAVLADLNTSNEEDGEAEVEEAEKPPVIYFGPSGTDGELSARLDAVRRGGAAFLPAPVDIVDLLRVLNKLGEFHTDEPSRILIVDDDPASAAYVRLVLEKAGMVAHVVEDVANLEKELDVFVPDLFLFDLYLPDCTGAELAQVIGQDDRYASIPVVFLSGEDEPNRQLEALLAGGAAFLQKPVRGTTLLPLVRNLTRRSRRLRGVAFKDPVSGLYNHTHLKMQLDHETSRAARDQRHLTYVTFAIDHFSAFNALHGYPAGDMVLRYLAAAVTARIRRTDACGRLAGSRFGLVLPGATGAQAEDLLHDIRATLAGLEVVPGRGAGGLTLSCGGAEFGDGKDARTLVEAAEEALVMARKAGGDRVVHPTEGS